MMILWEAGIQFDWCRDTHTHVNMLYYIYFYLDNNNRIAWNFKNYPLTKASYLLG